MSSNLAQAKGLHALLQEAARLEETALAPSTVASYESAIRYVRALETSPRELLPCDSTDKVKAVFASIQGRPVSFLHTLRAALQWQHRIDNCQPPPLDDPSLRHFWMGLQKTLNHRVASSVQAITPDEVREIFSKWIPSMSTAADHQSPPTLRDQAIAVLCYYGCQRFANLKHIERCQITPAFDRVSGNWLGWDVEVLRQKGDRYGRGQWLHLPRRNRIVAIGDIIHRFLRFGPPDDGGPLFRAWNARTGHWVAPDQGPLSDDAFQRTWKARVQEALPHTDGKTVYCLRKGGASRLYELTEVPDLITDILGHQSLADGKKGKGARSDAAYIAVRPQRIRDLIAQF
uniref:Tyr recombinase domain-containing protein n=1 Tax=Chromera velia CCMP2878 TaxID=1169474 RepID=A0A0G4GK04_9ALVE|eukprot:Cvel_22236.t1-p1 / transcript=Cvel_22236.t1 / gene=Cvel_22236 / organism=Chromera_velia_CCMP2878 / gene_product=hypothetical protein / transcript_product=hypothetical protein / location=Cvel_scaffold2164:24119-25150(+) / protein_length=344 / sequence_SO=supercontig / SO=protein_coding / is_pseudo=false